MLIDLQKFIVAERPFWSELEGMLDTLERRPELRLTLGQVERFHYLYQRTSADLAKIKTLSAEPNTRAYLESMVARAFGEIHETRERPHRLAPLHWFFGTFPQTFRRHINAFWICLAAMLAGSLFGGFVLIADPDSKPVLLPFSHLHGDPSDRVAAEESALDDRLQGAKSSFSSYLMTHNTKVSIFTLALGLTWGIGTLIMLFYNGVILGAVALDYVLAGALIGWGKPLPLKSRLRKISGDLVTLICGIASMLIWAGIIEAFFSQYHEPVIPYAVKIGFGTLELILLVLFLTRSGKGTKSAKLEAQR